MARYKLLKHGVYDNELGYALTAHHPRWREYITWLRENTPDPYEPPPEPPISPEEEAARAELAARDTLREQLRGMAVIQQLRGRSPADVDTWIQTNVTDLASAKVVLRILAYVVAFLARERLS